MALTLNPETAASLAATIKASISDFLERHGERPPGSPGERACQEQLKAELEAAGFNPTLEPFPVAQKAFMAMPLVCALLTLCSIPLYWIAPALSPLPVLLAVVAFVCELLFYRHVLTPFFPKSTSYNLYAALPPRGERKRRIVFAGHADAAYEWRFFAAARASSSCSLADRAFSPVCPGTTWPRRSRAVCSGGAVGNGSASPPSPCPGLRSALL